MTTGAQAGKAHISKDGRTAVVSISVSFLQHGGRKQILSPPGTAPWSPARALTALPWSEYCSSAELAKAEKVNDPYLSRILRLTLIAPDRSCQDANRARFSLICSSLCRGMGT